MAYCDNCGNFDDSHNNESAFSQEWKNARKEFDENYQPDLYYYWDSPIEEDYNWRCALPDADCLCEICFDILNVEKKIKWSN